MNREGWAVTVLAVRRTHGMVIIEWANGTRSGTMHRDSAEILHRVRTAA